jgi:hypothetical protein
MSRKTAQLAAKPTVFTYLIILESAGVKGREILFISLILCYEYRVGNSEVHHSREPGRQGACILFAGA